MKTSLDVHNLGILNILLIYYPNLIIIKLIQNSFLFQLIAIATVAFHLYQLGLNVTNNYFEKDGKFRNFDNLESIFGSTKDSLERIIVLTYYLTYITIGMLLFLFAIMFTAGAYKVRNQITQTVIIMLSTKGFCGK